MTELVMVVPSRGRPRAVAELMDWVEATALADTKVLVAVDADDPAMDEYAEELSHTDASLFVSPADSGHVGAINSAALYALTSLKPFAIGKLDDDHRPRTKGWDTGLLTALRTLGTGIVYGNDLFKGRTLATAPVMSADIVQALGFMGPPVLRHLYVDNYWLDLGKRSGCLKYVPGVVIEHVHPAAGKADMDEGYARVNAPEAYDRDGMAYAEYLNDQFQFDVETVRQLRSRKG